MAKGSKLFEIFYGRNVSIIMRDIEGSQQLEDGSVARGNVIIDGVIVDEDTNYYYLSRSMDDDVDEALKKDDIIRIFVPRIEDMLTFEGEEGTPH